MKHLLAILCLTVGATVLRADNSPRLDQRLDENWRFLQQDVPGAETAAFDDSAWRPVTLPHDWSIEGKFDGKNPAGNGGGFLPTGIGWYRLHLAAPADWQDKKVGVEFEGVYMNADVWINGRHVATHPYGYTGFFVDLTADLKLGGDNVLAVKVDNSRQKNSRWYSGSGIYRHVLLHVTHRTHVAPWGAFVRCARADAKSAAVQIQTEIKNETSGGQSPVLQTVVLGPDGKEIGRGKSQCELAAGADGSTQQEVDLVQPPLWSPEHPQLCQAVTTVFVGDRKVDEVRTPFGVRSLTWAADKGLLLNGTPLKLCGGCVHGDNGVLGAAAFDRAEERKIELLKASGFNEIRTAHNPPSPALLDACDRLGMLVMEDAFDCWANGKNKFDYAVVFKDWWQRDIDSMVLRDRNHPAIIFWCTGNEIPNTYNATMGAIYGPKIVDEIHRLDPSRPVTEALVSLPKEGDPAADKVCASLDFIGCNYNLDGFTRLEPQHPARLLVCTETSAGNPALMWASVMRNVFSVGDNVWTAQDYLGESGSGRWFYVGDPTEAMDPPKNPDDHQVHPVKHDSDLVYPWHGAVYGDLDLLGHRRPAAHLRNITWDRGEKLALAVRQPEDKQKIYIVNRGLEPMWESWAWPGHEGKEMLVDVYSRYDQVRLYLNDKLLGEQPVSAQTGFKARFKLPYQPGTLRAAGLRGGTEAEKVELTTPGEPASIRLTPDRAVIRADHQDLSFVSVEAVDAKGSLQPNAVALVKFTLAGPGTMAGLGNADLKCEDSYQGTQCRLFHGRALVVIRSTRQAGRISLAAKADALGGAQTGIESR